MVSLEKNPKKSKTKKEIDVLSYHLVPKMEILGETEKNRILQKYGLEGTSQLPKLKLGDAAVAALGAKAGDVIKIYREDKTGSYAAYKVVKEK